MRYFFQKKRRLLLLLAVPALAFVLITANLSRRPGSLRLYIIDDALSGLVSTVQEGVSAFLSGTRNFFGGYFFLVGVKERNKELEAEMERLRSEIVLMREKAGSAERLAELLKFKESNPYEVQAARVVGYDGSGYYRTVTINKGTDEGLGLNMAVITERGVAGRVVKLHRDFAQVLLLVDYNSAIDAVIQRTRDKGIVVGSGGAVCEMKYVDRQADVQAGDLVITSGLGGIFPAGLVVGEVIEAVKEGTGLFQEVKVAPAVRVDKLEEVLVVTGVKP